MAEDGAFDETDRIIIARFLESSGRTDTKREYAPLLTFLETSQRPLTREVESRVGGVGHTRNHGVGRSGESARGRIIPDNPRLSVVIRASHD